jgi:predicted metalloprotease
MGCPADLSVRQSHAIMVVEDSTPPRRETQMKWRGRRTSSNIEDRRDSGGGRGGFGRMRGGQRVRMPGRRGKVGGGLGVIVIIVLALLLGVDPSALLTGGGGTGFTVPMDNASTGPNQIDDTSEEFVGVVLADTEEIWTQIFNASGQTYQAPKLVLFSGRTASACGAASAASGPFYCPGDRKAYLDMDFFKIMDRQLGAGGDFAQAYVIAHEIAHHVQNQLGVMAAVDQQRSGATRTEANQLSVMVELQADCFSGVWAHHAQQRFGSIETGDIDEALNAANKIGDDTLQRNAGQAVVPDSFTHGSSKQRMQWFIAGFETGDPSRCDTFNAARL